MALAVLTIYPAPSSAQAALLMEEPYGFFGSVNPTGHNAIYFEHICAETPVKLRRCEVGEMGAVIARYKGIDGYDWVAMPMIPYLYSVEEPSQVPARADRATVQRLRDRYREAHLLSLGKHLQAGDFMSDGWTQLVGLSYERRIYAFRFETSVEQDDAFIAYMNDRRNRSHFSLLFSNCADFARFTLNFYFPGTFERNVFPDAGMTTPKQLAYKLERYAAQHPEMHFAIFEIPQIPGYRRLSHRNKSIAESLSTTGYAIPIAVFNPYLAGGLFADYLARGRHHLIPKHPQMLAPDNLLALTAPPEAVQNPDSAGAQVPSAAVIGTAEIHAAVTANSGLRGIKVAHE
ncbi:MAG: hypothetical protein ABSE55_04790 [Terracidiphilus sp.]|jgi:hypothetical protein